jgi:ribosome-associated translation inhibitor RaiA
MAIHGAVPAGMRELATEKLGKALRHASEPVLQAQVALIMSADPAVGQPAVARASVDLNGHAVRAAAAGPTMREAIDRMAGRLRARLDRSAHSWAARRPVPAAQPHEWRHQSIPPHRPRYLPRPAEQRQVIRHFSYAAQPEFAAGAAAELDLLDYDFHLFREQSTGEDGVVYRSDGQCRLALARPRPGRLGPVPPGMTVSETPAPRLTVAEAITRLESLGQPFAFFTDSGTGRGSVIYHRYDGHYGLIVPADAG